MQLLWEGLKRKGGFSEFRGLNLGLGYGESRFLNLAEIFKRRSRTLTNHPQKDFKLIQLQPEQLRAGRLAREGPVGVLNRAARGRAPETDKF